MIRSTTWANFHTFSLQCTATSIFMPWKIQKPEMLLRHTLSPFNRTNFLTNVTLIIIIIFSGIHSRRTLRKFTFSGDFCFHSSKAIKIIALCAAQTFFSHSSSFWVTLIDIFLLCTLMLHNNMNLDEFAWELAVRNSWWCNIRSHFNTFLSYLHGYWHIFTFFFFKLYASICAILQ